MSVNTQIAGVATVSEENSLDDALNCANIPTLIAVLAHLTGEDKWLQEPYAPARAKGLDDNDDGGLPPEIQDEIRDAVRRVVVDYQAGLLAPEDPSPERVARILSAILHEEVPSEYGPLLSEEMGFASRAVRFSEPANDDFVVGIIGAGMSGIAAARELENSGVRYEVLEKNDGVGGTWFENKYPGCGVDTPSSLYSYSFAPKPDWSGYFAKRDEVFQYFREIAEQSGIYRHIRFGIEVDSLKWDAESATWLVVAHDRSGVRVERRYHALVSAVGQVNRPSIPNFEGIESFRGIARHTAEWDESIDLSGKRVIVVGTGASAMQVVPTIADSVDQLTIFQRSRHWALPHPNYQRPLADGVRLANELIPFYTRWYRLRAFWNFGDRIYDTMQIDPEWPHPDRSINKVNESHRVFLTNYVKEQLGDRQDLLDVVLPKYPPYTKRPLIDNGWYKTLTRPNVRVVESGVSRITEDGVLDEYGAEHAADIIIFATGFKIQQFLYPMEITGRSGKQLTDWWGIDDARAYLGVTVPDFPNLFILNGPNTFAGHGGSAILATEFQLRYTLQCLDWLRSTNVRAIEVREDVCDEYNDRIDEKMNGLIWSHRGTSTYFRNAAGRVVVNSPWKYIDYWRMSRDIDPSDYIEIRD
ncbi:flavin-containing monooxygenase [Rhodococcus pyridinivorans]|uniref:flavin-containing monooxygenase n=1 Tax=Rhodococcus pyridinivorans TaxID=103816 RepID=UPI001EE6FBB4|nr:NAD(P)/FAD-dependent oxidoreductase [Rhodococcus pyridinivorans]